MREKKAESMSIDYKITTLFNINTFKQLLSNPTGLHMFRSFLEKESSVDNLNFYLEVESFKNANKVDKKLAGKIFATYINDGSEKELNIFDEDRIATIESLKKPSLSMFDTAQKTILTTMYNDSYRRFLQEALQIKIQKQLSSRTTIEERNAKFQGLGDCFCISEPGLPDDPIIAASDGFVRVTGYERDSIIGYNCRFLQGEGTDKQAIKRIGAALRGNREVTEIILNYKKCGTPFWNLLYVCPLRFPGESKPSFFLGGQVDITSNVNNESPLKDLLESYSYSVNNSNNKIESTRKSGFFGLIKSQRSFNTLPAEAHVVDSSKSVVEQKEAFLETYSNFIVLDCSKDYQITFVGKRFTEVTGFQEHEVYGKSVSVFGGPLTSKKFKKEFKDSLKNGLPYSQEVVSYDKNGDAFINHIYLTPLFSQLRKPRFFVCVMKWDVIEEEQIEELKFKSYSESEESVDCLVQ